MFVLIVLQGVLIAELLTCRDAPGLVHSIAMHVYRRQKPVIELLDKRSGFTEHAARELFDLAMQCTEEESEDRPNMQHVLNVLQALAGNLVFVLAVDFCNFNSNNRTTHNMTCLL